MFRKLITALLIIATVAGPQWCCCTMHQWLAGSALVASQNGGTRLPPCCTHSGSSGSDRQAPTDRSSCPCKQRSDIAQSNSTTEAVQDLLRSTDRVWELLILNASTLAGSLSEPYLPTKFAGGSAPVFGGRDLLRTYQVMRC